MGWSKLTGGAIHSAGRLANGQIWTWGSNIFGQRAVPSLPSGTSYVDVACGAYFTLATRSDGQLLAFGSNNFGQCNVPALPPGLGYYKIAAGVYHSLALRSDGALVAFGDNTGGQCNVPPLPSGLRYTDMAAGSLHSIALRSDGEVLAWGFNNFGQLNVPPLPPGFKYTAVWSGEQHCFARREPRYSATAYCVAGTSTNGCQPAIGATSSTFSLQGTQPFQLAVYSSEPQKAGLIFYGVNGRADSPWGLGSSRLCVAPPLQRMTVQNSGGVLGHCTATFSEDWRAYMQQQPTAIGNPLSAGQRINVQGWYRDPPAPKTTNLTGALEFFVVP